MPEGYPIRYFLILANQRYLFTLTYVQKNHKCMFAFV